MRASLGVFVGALLVAVALTPLIRTIARRYGVVDRPGGRRVNTRLIPRLGGLAVVAAFYAPLLVLFGTESTAGELFFAMPLRVVGLGVGGLLLAGLGALDDIVGVSASRKLACQTGVAVLAWYCGFRMEAVGLPLVGNLSLGVFGLPVTVLWIVAVVNAINLIDGLDGLAAGIAFFVCVTNFVVATINGNPLVMLLSGALGGGILGFLLYNFNPATIFMGDSGSMFLGYVLATTSMLGASIQGSTTVAILVPLIAMGVPIIDTLFAMLRRILERRSIFAADRGHIHHRLLDLGLTHRRAVLILYGVTIVLTAGAITVALGRNWEVGLALLLMTVAMVGLVRFVGYFEYLQLRREQKKLTRAPATEAMRRAVLITLARIQGSGTLPELTTALSQFAAASGVIHLDIVAKGEPVPLFGWRAEAAANGPTASVAFDLETTPPSTFAVILHSEDGTVPAQAEILLRLIADAYEERILRGEWSKRSGITRLRTV